MIQNIENIRHEEILRQLAGLHKEMTSHRTILEELQYQNEPYPDVIRIDNALAQELIGVSESTLQRWRKEPPPEDLRYFKYPNGIIYYLYDDLIMYVKRGQSKHSNFDRVRALYNLRLYKYGPKSKHLQESCG